MELEGPQREKWTEDACVVEVPDETTGMISRMLRKPRKRAWRHFQDFCKNTSLHGLHYIGETDRPMVERLCWVLAFGLSLGICIAFILQLKYKWDSSPVMVSFSQSGMPVWDIPFPAVTICPESKIVTSRFNFSALSTNNETAASKLTGDLALVCSFLDYEEHFNETTDEGALETIAEAAPSFNYTIQGCLWRNSQAGCRNLFRPLMTDEGLCYSFNILDEDDLMSDSTFKVSPLISSKLEINFTKHPRDGWNLEGGYMKHKNEVTFPIRTTSSGLRAGLRLVLRVNETEVDRSCSWPAQGFKVYLHNPAEFPQMQSQFFRVPVDRDMVVTAKPAVMTTSKDLFHYPPHKRQCYFVRERRLRYFKVYTEANCELECLTNVTEEMCGCVAYFMPRDNSSIPICGAAQDRCLYRAEAMLYGVRDEECQCLPACTEIKYDVETSMAGFDWRRVVDDDDIGVGDTIAVLGIYFQETQVVTLYRSELYGVTTFLANCGGILGLFLGFSLLSFVEVVYFLTIRLYCTFKQRRRRLHSHDQ